MPSTKVLVEVARVISEEGYIEGYSVEDTTPQKTLHVTLKYGVRRARVISGIKRISKPGLRIYTAADKLPRVLGGLGTAVISTSKGMAGLPSALISSVTTSGNVLLTAVTLIVIIAIVPLIVFVERGQRRIPVQYAKRVVGRKMMGGQSTYLPIKVNTAGVVPIIFASAILYLPAQLAVFFPNIGWVNVVANALSSGWINWVLSVVLIVVFAYFYTSMVFNPEETSDQLRKQGGFIPGVRPGAATAAYIKSTIDHITLPGALFMARFTSSARTHATSSVRAKRGAPSWPVSTASTCRATSALRSDSLTFTASARLALLRFAQRPVSIHPHVSRI